MNDAPLRANICTFLRPNTVPVSLLWKSLREFSKSTKGLNTEIIAEVEPSEACPKYLIKKDMANPSHGPDNQIAEVINHKYKPLLSVPVSATAVFPDEDSSKDPITKAGSQGRQSP